MADPMFYVDTSEIREGQLEEVKQAITSLVQFIESQVPRAISYAIYLNEDERQMTVVQVHPDSASMEHHMQAGASAFAKFKELIRLRSIDVYGEPSERLRQQLSDKARMLGDGTLTVHELQAGFARFDAP